jgi:hydroxycarboxylate dehydrogenase B
MLAVDATTLENYAREVFLAAGATDEAAAIVATHLVGANLAGHDSHGVIRIPWYVRDIKAGLLDPRAQPRIERETGGALVIDGGWTFGQVVARFAMQRAIEKARETAVACVVTYNSHHAGRIGAYPEMAAAAGMAAIASVNNGGGGLLQAPYGGTQRRMSPNPISIGFPTGGTNFLLDMTTCVVAGGKIDVARNKGAALPEGWAVNDDGTPLTDPATFRTTGIGAAQGAILPLGGPVAWKGYGLAFALDILCGALGPAGVSRGGEQRFCNGLFAVVLNVSAFGAPETFAQRVEELADWCRSSETMPGVDEILIAGEPEARNRATRSANGIPLDAITWSQIADAAATVGVKPPVT